MKVLILVPRIYEPAGDKFVKHKAGLELYVHDIAQELAKKDEVYVLTHSFGTRETINGIHYISHTKWDVLSGVKAKSVKRAWQAFRKAKGNGLKNRLKHAAFEFDYGYYEKAILRLQPDIVHFHGCARGLLSQLAFCKERGIPVLVTLHGLIGLDPSVHATRELMEIEAALFRLADQEGLPMTVISSGVKRRAVAHYGLANGGSISIILNGTDFLDAACGRGIDIHEKYGIPRDKRIICCVGSISEGKNQAALVAAWPFLSEELRQNTLFLLIGCDLSGDSVPRLIAERGLQNHLLVCGFIPRNEIPAFYEVADINVLVSLNEGFGLSIIEAMSHGVPTVTYGDLDAAPDLYDETVMLLPEDRSPQALAVAITNALSKNWDRQLIKERSGQYALVEICGHYRALYQSMISGCGR